MGEKALKKVGGLDKAIKLGLIKEFIKRRGYVLILDQYRKDNFVFDLSVGSFTSTEFKRDPYSFDHLSRIPGTLIIKARK